jgi:signal peptidase I
MIITITVMIIFVINFKIIFVDGQSMSPTLKNKQAMFVFKNSHSYDKNSIIVFDTLDYDVCVKRIIASGGDTVKLKDGNIYVNDIHISPYSCDTALEQIYTLTDNQYFVIGDNFNASIDSRMYGPIRLNDIIGKVIYF